MNLVIVPVPKDIKYRFIRTLLYCLESHKRAKRWKACEQKESLRNELFYLVEQRVCHYFQSGLLNKDETSGPPSTIAAPIAAIILMAAGYILTVDDYKIGNRETGGKPRYHSYNEILNMELGYTMVKSATDIRSLDLPPN